MLIFLARSTFDHRNPRKDPRPDAQEARQVRTLSEARFRWSKPTISGPGDGDGNSSKKSPGLYSLCDQWASYHC